MEFARVELKCSPKGPKLHAVASLTQLEYKIAFTQGRHQGHVYHKRFKWKKLTLKYAIPLFPGPPVVSADYLERYVAQEGDTVKILCPITGTPKPLIEWYQDDRMIPPTWVRFRINRRYIKIKDVVLADTGSYVCKGINGFGSESVALHLVVRGKERHVLFFWAK